MTHPTGCTSDCNYIYSLDNGGYGPVDPPYYGTKDITGSPGDTVSFADIFLDADPSLSIPALEFNTNVYAPLADQVVSGNLDLDLEDTTGGYELELVIDNASDLFSGADGAYVSTNSELVTYPGDIDLVGNFSGSLDVPAPGALPLFVSALTMLAGFRRRGKQSTVA